MPTPCPFARDDHAFWRADLVRAHQRVSSTQLHGWLSPCALQSPDGERPFMLSEVVEGTNAAFNGARIAGSRLLDGGTQAWICAGLPLTDAPQRQHVSARGPRRCPARRPLAW